MNQDEMSRLYRLAAQNMAPEFVFFTDTLERKFGARNIWRIREGIELLLRSSADIPLSGNPKQKPAFFYIPSLETPPVPNIEQNSTFGQFMFCLEKNFNNYRSEILNCASPNQYLKGDFGIQKFGDDARQNWKSIDLFANGIWKQNLPEFFEIMAPFESIVSNEIMVSRLPGGTKIPLHYNNDNYHYTLHLGMDIPEDDCFINICDEYFRWHNGKCLVFSDSYCHFVENNSSQHRDILLFDIWHPDLSQIEIYCLKQLEILIRRARNRVGLT